MKENNLNVATFELREKDLKESFTVQLRSVPDQTSAVEKIILNKNSSYSGSRSFLFQSPKTREIQA